MAEVPPEHRPEPLPATLAELEARLQASERECVVLRRELNAALDPALVANLPDVIVRVDRDLRTRYITPNIARLQGADPAHYLGRTPLEAGMPPAIYADFAAAVAQAFNSGEPEHFEFSNSTPEGERSFEARVIPELGPDDAATALLIIRDITEQRRAEVTLRERERQLEANLLQQARLQGMQAAALRAMHDDGHDQLARQRILATMAVELCRGVAAESVLLWRLDGPDLLLVAAADPEGQRPTPRLAVPLLTLPEPARDLLRVGAPTPAPLAIPAFARAAPGTEEFYLLPLSWPGTTWGAVALAVLPTGLDAKSLAHTATVLEIAVATLRRWQAVDALQESERRLRLAVEAAEIGIWELELASNRLTLSAEHARLLGLSSSSHTMGLESGLALIHPEDRAEAIAALQRAIAGRLPMRYECRFVHSDGTTRWMLQMGQVFGPKGQAERLIGVVMDITGLRETQAAVERLNAQLEHRVRERTAELELVNRALRQEVGERARAKRRLAAALEQMERMNLSLHHSGRLLQTIIDTLDDALLLLDDAGTVLLANRAAAALCQTAPEALVNRPWHQVRPFASSLTEQALHEERVVAGRQQISLGGQSRSFDIVAFPAQDTGAGRRLVLHIVDVTERLQFEALTLQNERLAATGRLAAVVAHEVNSPLQAIQNFLFLAATDDPLERDQCLHMISDEIGRIGELIRRLLDLHRPADAAQSRLDMNLLLGRVLALISSSTGRQRIAVHQELDPRTAPVFGRGDQLTQVLLNLLLNAMDAMPKGGELRVRTVRRPVLPDDAMPEPAPAEVVELEVADTGSGIPAPLLARIFEPFFTTKATGSGLGLAISSQLVEQHRGRLLARNRERGAAFTVLLPAAEPDLNQSSRR